MDSSTLVKAMIGAAIAVVALGCGEPSAGDPAYKQGDLGKGGFLFGCADGAACRTFYSNDAEKFPEGIASGSTFGVRFVANEDKGNGAAIVFDDFDTEYGGNYVEGLTPFFGKAAGKGIAAVKPGIGTLVARAPDGRVIDVTSLEITKTDKLRVYDADDDDASVSITSLTISMNDSNGRKVRIVGQSASGQNLAGSISHAWTFEPTGIARVDSKTNGVSTFVAEKPGTTTATVTGANVTQTITVEVKP